MNLYESIKKDVNKQERIKWLEDALVSINSLGIRDCVLNQIVPGLTYKDTYGSLTKEYKELTGKDFNIKDHIVEKEEPIKEEEERYSLVDYKSVYDADGFTTEYSLYKDNVEGTYFTIFGDKDLYRPDNADHDMDFDSEKEAREFYDTYEGFNEAEKEVEEPKEVIKESMTDGDYFGAAEDYPDSGLYFLSDISDDLKHKYHVSKFHKGDTVYVDHGSEYSDPCVVVGYGESAEHDDYYYAIKFKDGYVGMGNDDTLISEDDYNNLDDESMEYDNEMFDAEKAPKEAIDYNINAMEEWSTDWEEEFKEYLKGKYGTDNLDIILAGNEKSEEDLQDEFVAEYKKKNEADLKDKFTESSMDEPRYWTNLLFSAIDEGKLTYERVCNACLNYMSEDDVKRMCDSYDYTPIIDPNVKTLDEE